MPNCSNSYCFTITDCQYGDKQSWCDGFEPQSCYAGSNAEYCCMTCAEYETGIAGMSMHITWQQDNNVHVLYFESGHIWWYIVMLFLSWWRYELMGLGTSAPWWTTPLGNSPLAISPTTALPISTAQKCFYYMGFFGQLRGQCQGEGDVREQGENVLEPSQCLA